MIVSLLPFDGTSKNGKPFHCYKLTVGDFETLIFPRGNMESNYLAEVIRSGVQCEIESE